MASASSVVPTEGHINDVYGQLLAVLDTEDTARTQSEVEDMRQVRFVLRKFFHSMIKLTTSGSSDKEAWLEAAQAAGVVDGASPQDKNIASSTAEVLCGILEEAPWGQEDGVPLEQHSINVSIKGIECGIKAAIDALSAALRENGTETLEYDEVAPVSTVPETPSKNRSTTSAVSTPSYTPYTSSGSGNFGHSTARKYTKEEKLEILRVIRDIDPGTHSQRNTEFNRRMAAKSIAKGVPPETPRTDNAYRLQVKNLREAKATIEDLEAALGLTGGDGEDG